MRPLAADEIRGTWATVLTPFDSDGSLSLEALDDELDRLIAARPDGLYTHGTAGEFFTQTDDEWEAVAELVARRASAAGIPFQLGASHMAPPTALERIRRARRHEPSAIQVILPDWIPLNRDEVRDVVRVYAEAAGGIGLVLYNPPHAKNVLAPDALDDLTGEFSAIVGVKTADGDDAWYRAMRPTTDRVSVFVPGHHLATGLGLGARGAYSNVACLHPAGAVEWGRRSATDRAWGLGIERMIAELFAEAVAPLAARGYSNVTLDKALAAAGGHLGDVGRVRWPHRTATLAEIERIREAAARLLPPLLAPADRP
ncbi:MAG: dihydrodipicolinate synthase family protein [Microbacterium sp.]